MIVENIILRNVIINQDADDVDNHISRNDFFDYHPLKNVIFILLYQALLLHFFTIFSSNHEVRRTAKCIFDMDGGNNIFHKRVMFVNSFGVQADHDRRLNKSCHNH